MPNHVHVLVEPIGGHLMKGIVGAWKSVSSRKILASHPALNATEGGRAPRTRRLWQRDYWDRYIRNERHYLAVVDYIHQNPVKAALAAVAEAWPYSSAPASERDRPRSQ